jgi:Protein of unknown function (DUF2490)
VITHITTVIFIYQFVTMSKTSKNIIVILAVSFLSMNSLLAQKDLKAWGAVSVQIPVVKNVGFNIEHLRGYNATNNFKNEFNQFQGRLGVKIGNNIDMAFGDIVTLTPGSAGITNRVFIRGTHKVKIGDVLRWRNAIQAEMHSNNETRYHYRAVLSSRINLKSRLTPLRLAPSVTGFVFYNMGGKAIQYYDSNKQPIAKQTPDGIHRARLLFNLNSKISDRFNISLYYMMQKEFNLANNPYHNMNIINPVSGKTIRPFDNYNVAGITLGINLSKDENGNGPTPNN